MAGNGELAFEGASGMGVESFRQLAADWIKLRQALGELQEVAFSQAQRKARALQLSSSNQGTWELLVTSAAYVLLDSGNLGAQRVDLYRLLRALPTPSSGDMYLELPGFVEMAEAVASMPISVLYSHVQELRAILDAPDVLMAADCARLKYCQDKHKNDRDGFRRCMKKNGLAP